MVVQHAGGVCIHLQVDRATVIQYLVTEASKLGCIRLRFVVKMVDNLSVATIDHRSIVNTHGDLPSRREMAELTHLNYLVAHFSLGFLLQHSIDALAAWQRLLLILRLLEGLA